MRRYSKNILLRTLVREIALEETICSKIDEKYKSRRFSKDRAIDNFIMEIVKEDCVLKDSTLKKMKHFNKDAV